MIGWLDKWGVRVNPLIHSSTNPLRFRLSRSVPAQLYIPVSEVEKMFPAFVMGQPDVHLDKRTPFRTFRFAHQMQACLLRSAICFSRVAGNAGANNVFPGRWPAAVTRNNVIEIQIFALKNLAAVLAGVPVTLENIVPRELHFLFRKTIEHHQKNHARNTNFE